MSGSVTDNTTGNRFELVVDGETAFLDYKRTGNTLTLVHTEVPVALRGHHVGEALVEGTLRAAREAGLSVVPVCPFVKAYMLRHPASPA